MNVIKHTDASGIGIYLSRHTDGNILLQITDNGHPIYPNRPQTEEKGIGLRTISDRAKAILISGDKLGAILLPTVGNRASQNLYPDFLVAAV